MDKIEKPILKIGGKSYEIGQIKAKIWRDLTTGDGDRITIPKMVGVIAEAFDVTVEDVENGLNVEDVLPLYLEVNAYVMALITSKLDSGAGSKKN